MNWSELSAEQQTVVWCLAEGDSLASACRAARVHPPTVLAWCEANRPLLRALAALEEERREDLEHDLLVWAEENVPRVQRLLRPESTPEARLDASLFILNRVLNPIQPDFL